MRPSQHVENWLKLSGLDLVPAAKTGRTRWHFAFVDGEDFTHVGFCEQKDIVCLRGLAELEIDKRWRPFFGFPMKSGYNLTSYLHAVINKDATQVALFTPWSFADDVQDFWNEDTQSMWFVVPSDRYAVYDLDRPAGKLIDWIEVG